MRYPVFNLFGNNLSTLIYFVTQRCNAQCQMCWNYKNLNRDASKELNVSEIKSICRNLRKLTLLVCSGGEPFLKEDLFEILNTFAAISAGITVPTNAFLPEVTERITSMLVSQNKNTLFRVCISIDGLGDLHDRIRDYKGGFNLLMDTFFRLKRIQMKNRNLLLTFNTVFTKLNEPAIKNIIDFAYDLRIDGHTITYVWGNPKDAETLVPSLESYRGAFQYAHAKSYLGKKCNFPARVIQGINKLSDIVMMDILEKKKIAYYCKAIKKFTVMLENGDIAPCQLLIDKNLGNVRNSNYDIQCILKNNKATELIREIYNKRCCCTLKCCNRINLIYNMKTVFYLMRYFPKLI